MPDPVYTDTLKSGIVSKWANKYGQAYCTSYVCSSCHPIAQISESHDTILLMFKRDGVPTNMTVDKSKDKSLEAFAHKCR